MHAVVAAAVTAVSIAASGANGASFARLSFAAGRRFFRRLVFLFEGPKIWPKNLEIVAEFGLTVAALELF
jgi:hypothetical protein